jgi:hypothetical protein
MNLVGATADRADEARSKTKFKTEDNQENKGRRPKIFWQNLRPFVAFCFNYPRNERHSQVNQRSESGIGSVIREIRVIHGFQKISSLFRVTSRRICGCTSVNG